MPANRSEYGKTWRALRARLGLCSRCDRRIDKLGTKTTCGKCAERMREQSRRRYQAKTALDRRR